MEDQKRSRSAERWLSGFGNHFTSAAPPKLEYLEAKQERLLTTADASIEPNRPNQVLEAHPVVSFDGISQYLESMT